MEIKMAETKVNLKLSQMVDLAVVTPRVGAVNSNVLHTLLHAMLRQLNIVDGQAEANLNDYDRDVLSALKAKELSVLSDIDSGGGDDAEDGLSPSEKYLPSNATGMRTPHQWHQVDDTEDAPTPSLRLSIDSKRSSSTPRLRTGKITPHQVASIQEELNNISSVPSNQHLFKRVTTPNKGKPIAEMWLSMLLFRVQTNEKGIDQCMSMIEDMTKENQALRDEHRKQMDQIKGLKIYDVRKRLNVVEKSMLDCCTVLEQEADIDDLMSIFNGMKKSMNEMNDKVHTLPSSEDFAKCVTEVELEDALQGTRQNWENLQQPMGRVVADVSSQTDPVTGMKKKLDAFDELNVSSQIKELREKVDALTAAREKEEAWRQQFKVFSNDIDGRLDGLEFKPVKEWLLRRLKELNDMLPTGPVPSSMTSVSSHQSLQPTISPRPDLTLEVDQILPHGKSDTVKQKAKKNKYGQKVVKFLSKVLKPFRKAKSQK